MFSLNYNDDRQFKEPAHCKLNHIGRFNLFLSVRWQGEKFKSWVLFRYTFCQTAKGRVQVGGVGDDRLGEVNYEIPLQAKAAIESINPDFLFDAGDMTDHGKFNEYRAYQNWKEAIDAPIYPVMGNHDREHKPSMPYETGFYFICGCTSATRGLKSW